MTDATLDPDALETVRGAAEAAFGDPDQDATAICVCTYLANIRPTPTPGGVTREAELAFARSLLRLAEKWTVLHSSPADIWVDVAPFLTRPQSARSSDEALREALQDIAELVELSPEAGDKRMDDFDRGARAARLQAADIASAALRAPADPSKDGKLTSEEVRAFALRHDHLAVPLRPGVAITWTDEETGEVLGRGSLKGRNVVHLRKQDGEAG